MVAMEKDGRSIGILVLAAGKGTRMKSDSPKVMQPIMEKPMLYYVLKSLSSIGDIAVVIGHGGEEVRSYLSEFWPGVDTVWQREQLGTGHAVMEARDWISRFDRVLVVNGDMPLMTENVFSSLMDLHKGGCSFLTMILEDPHGYGRIVRDPIVKIVEQKDCLPDQSEIKEVNAGVYLMDVVPLLSCLDRLNRNNAQGEYYLVDVIESFQGSGLTSLPVVVDDSDTMLGVNDPSGLAKAGTILRDRYVARWMASGVKFIDPLSVWVGPEVTFEGEAIVYPGVQIWGNTSIGVKSTIGSFSTLRNAVLEESVTLNGYCFIEDSILKRGSKAGPFCYIRERSVLDQDGFIGKFVEVKKSHVGRGSKVPHLSYMGDASLGEGVNIGAGTITCNYDGKSKHPTKIGDGVFVGSDTMLVAPLTLGARSMTGAGSVITKDVPDEALAIGRAKQRNILGWNGDRSKKSEGIDHDDK